MSGTINTNLGSDSSSTSHSLLRRVKRDDAAAWQRLVTLYTPLVCYWCRIANLNQEDTEEVAQETFRAVYLHIAEFTHEKPRDTFRGWLRTITGNKIRDLRRKAKRTLSADGGSEAMRRIVELPDVIDDDETGVLQSLYQRALRLIQDKFEPQTWQAFILVVIDDLSPEAAARQLNTTPGAVRTARWRVLQALRMQLGDVD